MPAPSRPLSVALGRRSFLKQLAAASGGLGLAAHAQAQAPSALPRRVLGRTGLEITTIGLGSAPVGHSKPGAAVGVPVYRAALEAGITYVDTAHYYDDAEAYLGELMPEWRDRIVLATKVRPDGADTAARRANCQRQFEQSLRLLRTDHVDVLHLHSIANFETDALLAKGGPLDFALQMKAEGKTRFIGITGHNRPARFRPLLATGQIDVIMVALNFVDLHTYPFEAEVLPLARAQGCGIIAMKVYGGHAKGFSGYKQAGPSRMPKEWLAEGFRYPLSLEGVACNVVGCYTADEIRQSADWARTFQPLDVAAMEALRARGRQVATAWGPRFGAPV